MGLRRGEPCSTRALNSLAVHVHQFFFDVVKNPLLLLLTMSKSCIFAAVTPCFASQYFHVQHAKPAIGFPASKGSFYSSSDSALRLRAFSANNGSGSPLFMKSRNIVSPSHLEGRHLWYITQRGSHSGPAPTLTFVGSISSGYTRAYKRTELASGETDAVLLHPIGSLNYDYQSILDADANSIQCRSSDTLQTLSSNTVQPLLHLLSLLLDTQRVRDSPHNTRISYLG